MYDKNSVKQLSFNLKIKKRHPPKNAPPLFWLHWVFVVAYRLSLAVVHGGFFSYGAQGLEHTGSAVAVRRLSG